MQRGAYHPRSHFTILLIASIVLQPLLTSFMSITNASISGFPELPSAGSPVVVNVPLQSNVVFMGLPEKFVDIDRLLSQLPANYTQVNRARRYTAHLTRYSEFKLKYNFEFASEGLADQYAEFIASNHTVNLAPWWIQFFTGTERAWYIRSEEAGSWVSRNGPYRSNQAGYTIILADTFHTTLSIKERYFYDATRPDPDTGLDAQPESTMFHIAFGGRERFLLIDLTAGPTIYRSMFQLEKIPEDRIWAITSDSSPLTIYS